MRPSRDPAEIIESSRLKAERDRQWLLRAAFEEGYAEGFRQGFELGLARARINRCLVLLDQSQLTGSDWEGKTLEDLLILADLLEAEVVPVWGSVEIKKSPEIG